MIDVVLDKFGFTNNNYYFVTDSARNMISALDDEERYSCSGHNINLALKHTLNNENEEIIKTKETIDCIKGIVTSMKRKGLMRKFAENIELFLKNSIQFNLSFTQSFCRTI
jgi:hypothetical protein